MFDRICDKIDSILLDNPRANIHVCGDFTVHHEEWLVHSHKTDMEGRHCHDFAIAYGLTQILTEPTHVPDVASYYPNLLDLFLTTCPDRSVSSVLSPLGRSYHSVVSVEFDTQLKETSDISSIELSSVIQRPIGTDSDHSLRRPPLNLFLIWCL